MSITKIYRRRFRTIIDLDLYTRIAQDVIDQIEKDTVNVFRPDDGKALADIQNADEAILLDARATLPVSIREWLPVTCQFIRWEYGGDALGTYHSNASEVLWPQGFDPAGPGALIAGVKPNRKACIDDGPKDEVAQCDALRCVLAHELVHAIHSMRFVVPAFMDWRAFWRNVLDYGGRCDLLLSNHMARKNFLDNHYGEKLELDEILAFWPSRGKQWFEACRRAGGAGVKPQTGRTRRRASK